MISDNYLTNKLSIDIETGTRISIWYDTVDGSEDAVITVNDRTFPLKDRDIIDRLARALGART